MAEVKKRRISKKDFEKIEDFVSSELGRREGRDTRKNMEEKWRVIDQQIDMQPPKTTNKSGKDDDWHSAIQFGAIADTHEIIASDVMRQIFPLDRRWFKPHTEIEGEIDREDGGKVINPKLQQMTDGTLRALMAQQHADFGLRDRVKLSVKEALAHGGFVAEARTETMTKFGRNGKVQRIKAPVWVPHSMWNCYPDPSPSVIGTELFYRGSMIIKEWMPRHKIMSNPLFINKDKIPKKKTETEDIPLTRYIGDIAIDRQDGKIQLNNYTIVLADKVLIQARKNDLPYSNIIYTGYERDDVRNEYYTSPLIKRSPTHTLMTEMGNRFVDGAELKSDPPNIYDAYDTTLVAEGGPDIYPGSSTAVKGGAANTKFLDIGDPSFMFEAFQVLRAEIERGTAVDATRSGVSASTEQTAFEVSKKDQKSEIRTVDFLGTLDRQGLKPFLYMQHDLNKQDLDNYEFFNNEINMPDFMRVSKSDVPDNALFEVVGSKEVLGEEQRAAKFISSVQFSSQIPQVSQRTNWEQVAQETWHFSGLKDPERFIVDADENAELIQQFEQIIQELQGQLQQLAQDKLADEQEVLQLETDVNALMEQIKIMEEQGQLQRQAFATSQKIINQQHKLELLNERLRQTQDQSQTS